MTKLITSPVGKISFSALNRKVKKAPTDTEATVFTLRLEIDGRTEEGAAFKKAVAEVNKGCIGTKHASDADHFTVQASTKFQPDVLTSEGEKLSAEEIPSLKGGTASMVLAPYLGNKLGGSLNLVTVVLGETELFEGNKEAEEAKRAAVLAALNKHK